MKLIAIDLDGTLLNSDHIISEENRNAIVEAQENGHTIVISSGRSYQDIKEIAQNATITCPYIGGNGAVSCIKDDVIQYLSLSTELVENIIEILEKFDIYYEFYGNDGIMFIPEGTSLLEKEFKQLQASDTTLSDNTLKQIIDVQYEQNGWRYYDSKKDDLSKLAIYKFYIYSFIPEKLEAVKEAFSKRNDITTTTSGDNKFEIAHKDASKGNALRHMAEYLQIPLENTVAIGDSYNDESMFSAANISIAMGNANKDVKKLCTHETITNDENGVAYALLNYVLKETASV